MPHSGGGGSHGGGFHGGGSHHSSGGGGSSGPRISRSYYTGAHRYVYYHHGRSYNYYSTRKPSYSRGSTIFACLFMFMFIAVGLLIMFVASTESPEKIRGNEYETSRVFDDNNKLAFSERYTLQQDIIDFQSKTGLLVYLDIVEKSETSLYSSLSNYAYDQYLMNFTNERGLYIVYCYKDSDSFYWAFETMFGDDTGDLFVGNREEEFVEKIDKALRRNSSIGEAFSEVFRDTDFVMKKTTDYSVVFIGLVWTVFSVFALVACINDNRRNKHLSESEEVEVNAPTLKCEYCGGSYVASKLTQCPHCGAAIKFVGDIDE